MRPDKRGSGVVPGSDVRSFGDSKPRQEHEDLELLPVGSGVYGLRGTLSTAPRSDRKILLPVVAGSFLFPLLLVLGGGVYGSLLHDQAEVRRVARADRFGNQTLAALAALPFDMVKGLDGRTWHDRGAPELSEFCVQLKVQPAGEGLLQVDAVVKDVLTRSARAQLSTVKNQR